jgi:hypothetical protein
VASAVVQGMCGDSAACQMRSDDLPGGQPGLGLDCRLVVVMLWLPQNGLTRCSKERPGCSVLSSVKADGRLALTSMPE